MSEPERRGSTDADSPEGVDTAAPGEGDAAGDLPAEVRDSVPEEYHEEAAELYPDVPDWGDEYLDRVSDRLMFNYDLEKDARFRGERFDLYGKLRMESHKQFLHRSINFANHSQYEHLLARRQESVRVADLERLLDLGHDLADTWVEPSEEHYGTDVTFALVVPEIPDDVADFVTGFSDRTLLRFGYYGHYELNLVVVAPDAERLVASENADVAGAFDLWGHGPEESPGLLDRLVRHVRR